MGRQAGRQTDGRTDRGWQPRVVARATRLLFSKRREKEKKYKEKEQKRASLSKRR
jgi:hypothetical protein